MRTSEQIQHEIDEYKKARRQAREFVLSAIIEHPGDLSHWVDKRRNYHAKIEALEWTLSEDD